MAHQGKMHTASFFGGALTFTKCGRAVSSQAVLRKLVCNSVPDPMYFLAKAMRMRMQHRQTRPWN
eukprot:11039651-Alexandrium_andersonii.AAC.1